MGGGYWGLHRKDQGPDTDVSGLPVSSPANGWRVARQIINEMNAKRLICAKTAQIFTKEHTSSCLFESLIVRKTISTSFSSKELSTYNSMFSEKVKYETATSAGRQD